MVKLRERIATNANQSKPKKRIPRTFTARRKSLVKEFCKFVTLNNLEPEYGPVGCHRWTQELFDYMKEPPHFRLIPADITHWITTEADFFYLAQKSGRRFNESQVSSSGNHGQNSSSCFPGSSRDASASVSTAPTDDKVPEEVVNPSSTTGNPNDEPPILDLVNIAQNQRIESNEALKIPNSQALVPYVPAPTVPEPRRPLFPDDIVFAGNIQEALLFLVNPDARRSILPPNLSTVELLTDMIKTVLEGIRNSGACPEHIFTVCMGITNCMKILVNSVERNPESPPPSPNMDVEV